MYKCMLNKVVDKPAAELVPVDEYLERVAARRPPASSRAAGGRTDWTHCTSEFILWYADLRREAETRGVLVGSSAATAWQRVVSPNLASESDGDEAAE